MATEIKEIGKINLENMVYVTDPCYSTDIWCSIRLDSVKKGQYVCEITVMDRVKAGKMNIGLTVRHTDIKTNVPMEKSGKAPVDSGQLGIYNGPYYEKNQPNEKWYQRNCDETLKEESYGILDGQCVVSSSGYGDGLYDIYTHKDENGLIDCIYVYFL